MCRALKYWEKRKLLKLEYDASSNLTGVRVLEHEASEGSPGPRGLDQPEPEKAKKAAKAVSGAEDAADAKDTKAAGNTAYAGNAGTSEKSSASGRIPTDLLSPQEAQQLLFICEQYLGKTLSSREVAQILDLHDSFGFSAELIEYLVEYCVSGGHKSIHYIEGTARGWHEACLLYTSMLLSPLSVPEFVSDCESAAYQSLPLKIRFPEAAAGSSQTDSRNRFRRRPSDEIFS